MRKTSLRTWCSRMHTSTISRKRWSRSWTRREATSPASTSCLMKICSRLLGRGRTQPLLTNTFISSLRVCTLSRLIILTLKARIRSIWLRRSCLAMMKWLSLMETTLLRLTVMLNLGLVVWSSQWRALCQKSSRSSTTNRLLNRPNVLKIRSLALAKSTAS